MAAAVLGSQMPPEAAACRWSWDIRGMTRANVAWSRGRTDAILFRSGSAIAFTNPVGSRDKVPHSCLRLDEVTMRAVLPLRW